MFWVLFLSNMNACIDLGNTYAKLAYFKASELKHYFKGLSEKELIENLKKVNPENIIVCSVTKSISDLIKIFEEFPHKILLDRATPIPIVNSYGTPETLGYDRLAAAVGAYLRFPSQATLIIDMVTAIKYDYIDSQARFLGGIISPGKQMRFKALHTFTKKLPLVNADDIPALIGTSTETCLQSGVINGIIAELNGIIENYTKLGQINIILSGGDAAQFESQLKYPTFAAPNLVLEGLNGILNYNVEK